ncbi:WhiB family transcriptional regulator [Parafrankia sp. FMc2]|uniref:WhiB family transcriptional regulator n=1 Tax=Parafrankia sp. FMc2 TaxID=3233196 RepID=UPI0034D3AF40
MTGDNTSGPACADHAELYDLITDLGDQAPEVALTRARHLCDGCSRTADCHAGAVDRGEQWGMWGGVLMSPPVEPTLDQRLGLRPGLEIGDLVEVLTSHELSRKPEVRIAALERLNEELEADAQRPAYLLDQYRPTVSPHSIARRHRGVPERVWLAARRAGVGTRRITDERAPVP